MKENNICLIFIVQDILFMVLQTMWIIFHLARITMIIEPCHFVTTEVNRTIDNNYSENLAINFLFLFHLLKARATSKIVCKLLKSKHKLFVVGSAVSAIYSLNHIYYFFPVETLLAATFDRTNVLFGLRNLCNR